MEVLAYGGNKEKDLVGGATGYNANHLDTAHDEMIRPHPEHSKPRMM